MRARDPLAVSHPVWATEAKFMMMATQAQLVRGTVLPPSDWESPVSLCVCVPV